MPRILATRIEGYLQGCTRIPIFRASAPKEDAPMSYLMLRILIALALFLVADGAALAGKIIGNG